MFICLLQVVISVSNNHMMRKEIFMALLKPKVNIHVIIFMFRDKSVELDHER